VNAINPRYLIALGVVVLAFAIHELMAFREDYETSKEAYYSTIAKANEFEGLKQKWGFDAKAMLASIVESTTFANENIEVQYTQNTAIIHLRTASVYGVESLLNKILNQPFNIKSINIQDGKEFVMTCVVAL
jgi:hypothetical protein